MHMKFEIEITKQTWLTLWKPCHLQSPETEKSNMAARRLFWKWRCWKSIGSYPYTYVLYRWSLKLVFKAKVKLESGNQKIQYGRQAAILKVTSLKINRLLPVATINMHMKFEIEILKKTWLMLRKPCRLQADGRTDRRTDGQTDGRTRWIQYTPPPTSLGGGIIILYDLIHYMYMDATTPQIWVYISTANEYRSWWIQTCKFPIYQQYIDKNILLMNINPSRCRGHRCQTINIFQDSLSAKRTEKSINGQIFTHALWPDFSVRNHSIIAVYKILFFISLFEKQITGILFINNLMFCLLWVMWSNIRRS